VSTITPPAIPAPGTSGATFTDPTGQFTSLNVRGTATAANPFFQPLGTNGRACVTCHQADQGWTITPPKVQALFARTNGLDPLFRTVDGANSPEEDVDTLAQRRSAYSMLLNRAVIRVGLPIPQTGEFTLSTLDDPYNFSNSLELSLFRRPLPATSLPFLSTVMWDGRKTGVGATLSTNLQAQAIDAILGHAEATLAPSSTVIQQIVAFETASATAQSFDNQAGLLTSAGATGGPGALVTQPFHIGINDSIGADPAGGAFNPRAFTLFNSWASTTATPAQQAIARGQAIFNNRRFTVMHVAGLNDALGQTAVTATCTTCHNTPNVGNHSVPRFFDLGLTDTIRRTPDLPLYTLKNKVSGITRETTDPGRALMTGKWNDIGKFKVPVLRGLAARAPYFHDGSARNIGEVIAFYDRRFGMRLTPQDRSDLAAFLNAL
jgi:hypothetical protein